MVINLGERFSLSCEDLSDLELSESLESQLLDFHSRFTILIESYKILKEKEYEMAILYQFIYPLDAILNSATLIHELQKDPSNHTDLNELFENCKHGFSNSFQQNTIKLNKDFRSFTKDNSIIEQVSNPMLVDLTYGFLRVDSTMNFHEFLKESTRFSEELILNKVCINDLKPRENFITLLKENIHNQISKPESNFNFKFNLSVDQLLSFDKERFNKQLNLLKLNSQISHTQTYAPLNLTNIAYGFGERDLKLKETVEVNTNKSFFEFLQTFIFKIYSVFR